MPLRLRLWRKSYVRWWGCRAEWVLGSWRGIGLARVIRLTWWCWGVREYQANRD